MQARSSHTVRVSHWCIRGLSGHLEFGGHGVGGSMSALESEDLGFGHFPNVQMASNTSIVC